jgi:hypothetical protein
LGRHENAVSAEHEELTMGEINHAHHAENDCQPDAQERQAGNRVQYLYYGDSDKIHYANPVIMLGQNAP